MTMTSRLTAVSLIGVILGLLAVGLVSGTPVRHLVQVLPATLALVPLILRKPWAPYAALPIFAIWLFIMVAIWLYLLGLARIVTGQFTTAESALTIVIGGSCLVGISQAFRRRVPGSRLACAMWFVIFAMLQIAAIWTSLRPAIARI